MLQRFHNETTSFELCIDEVGRGCLFGRAYIACVVLPKEPALFDGSDIKDSKRFTSKKKLTAVAERIRHQAMAYHIAHVEHDVIDEVNILQAVMRGMHECIRECLAQLAAKQGREIAWTTDEVTALIDGNYFTPYRKFDNEKDAIQELPFITVEKGDATYMGIAAASILAKWARDSYIGDLCNEYPLLAERYSLDTNVGYGTAKHLAGIREHGITQWHRRSFGDACKGAVLNPV
jgi:ribonuclease HII